jgi:DNA-binding transcriptional regulator GbsR (MarR family)
MAETTDNTKMTPVAQAFILHWGEMGTRWGINRTVAQIYALLFVSPKPLTAEEIADTLGVARSNVSNSLKELQNWGIVRIVHVLGDRRDHFESLKDVWEMFRIILDERKKRETDPTLHLLRDLAAQAEKKSEDPYVRQRLGDMLQFFELMTQWYEQTRKLPTPAVIKLCKLGDKVAKLLGLGG